MLPHLITLTSTNPSSSYDVIEEKIHGRRHFSELSNFESPNLSSGTMRSECLEISRKPPERPLRRLSSNASKRSYKATSEWPWHWESATKRNERKIEGLSGPSIAWIQQFSNPLSRFLAVLWNRVRSEPTIIRGRHATGFFSTVSFCYAWNFVLIRVGFKKPFSYNQKTSFLVWQLLLTNLVKACFQLSLK